MKSYRPQYEAKKEVLEAIIKAKFYDNIEIPQEVQHAINSIEEGNVIVELGVELSILNNNDKAGMKEKFYVIGNQKIEEPKTESNMAISERKFQLYDIHGIFIKEWILKTHFPEWDIQLDKETIKKVENTYEVEKLYQIYRDVLMHHTSSGDPKEIPSIIDKVLND